MPTKKNAKKVSKKITTIHVVIFDDRTDDIRNIVKRLSAWAKPFITITHVKWVGGNAEEVVAEIAKAPTGDIYLVDGYFGQNLLGKSVVEALLARNADACVGIISTANFGEHKLPKFGLKCQMTQRTPLGEADDPEVIAKFEEFFQTLLKKA